MQMSIGVEYAFHSLFYMVDLPMGKIIGIKELAKLNNVSESYLSKVFTKMRKGGIVRSIAGVNGGYELARPADKISFWDIVESVEGSSYSFQCAEIRQKNILADPEEAPPTCPCFIRVVMEEAEEQMRNFLRERSLQWLYNEVYTDFSENKKIAISEWLIKSIKN